jgi:hypothetical protein
MTAPATNTEHDAPNPWASSPGLVFLGFQITWKSKISDFERNQQFAQEWENDFLSWEAHDRRVELENKKLGYFVSLSDGAVYFQSENVDAYEKALEHATQLLGVLVEQKNEKAVARFEAQFIIASDKEFLEHQEALRPKLLQESFATAIEATVLDFAYLADVVIDGRWYQINIGPVRAQEIPRRIAARTVKDYPQVATFLSVTSLKPFEYKMSDLSEATLAAARVGTRISNELKT